MGSLTLLFLMTGFGIYMYYNGFKPEYSSGGFLSENQSGYDVSFYDINLEVLLEDKSLAGYTTIKLKPLIEKLDVLELDLIDNYQVDSILINGFSLDFKHQSHKIWLTLKKPLTVVQNEIITVTIYYSGQPPEAAYPPWLGGFSWETDNDGYAWVGLSCQGEGAKIWFPCKDHPSDEPDSAAINITVPEGYFVASNGILKHKSFEDKNRVTYNWFTSYPINNYLINFGVGRFKEVSANYIESDGTIIPVIFYVLPQAMDKARDLVDEAVDMLGIYSKYFGPFPWPNEKCGLLNSPFAGMEHQTLIAYGNNFKKSSAGDFAYDELLLHELAHEWWGNKITVTDWDDFWLHEGIATYAECLYVFDKAGERAYQECMDNTRQRIRNSRPVKSSANKTVSDAYHADIYTKGAVFMHTLRYVLGDSIFFKSLKQFATDTAFYKNGVTTGDFLNLLNKNSGQDLSGLFELYLETNTLPVVSVDSVSHNTYQIHIPNIDFEIPMDVLLNNRVERIYLGPETVEVISEEIPQVDPYNWYLKED